MTHPARISKQPEVTILMGVLNGEAHLDAQLLSIAAQTHRNWILICSDDGSCDASRDIIERFSRDHPGKVMLRNGPRAGFAANYLQLVAELAADTGHVCLADQDDVWLPHKISQALDALEDEKATLYCGRTLCWYPETDQMVPTKAVRRPCHLRNALIENVAIGNTIMLNPAAARVARLAAQRTSTVFAHDWWLYLLIAATGGKVHFENGPPQVLYRQHCTNQIGAGRGVRAQWSRKIGVVKGAFARRIEQNLTALGQIEEMLTPQAASIIAEFAAARRSTGFKRLRALHAVGPYRQHWQGNLGFWGAACLARI